MSVEQKKIIDFVGIDEKAGEAVLTISDHLDWEDPKNDHLLMLQDKINDYLAFIESGELLQKYPAAKGKTPVIQIYAKHPVNELAQDFLKRATQIVKDAGFELRFKLAARQ